ncbi:hypothetical protein RMCBS344292_02618 [Rhizopus microsporus]|nr:hypothetical protein RMCBS344292_02618 [Rhizopus microsporus]
MESPQHCVSKETHDEILAEHYRLEYGEGKADPYKSLIYKIIGRCELNKKSTAIIKSQEDYLWLQLMLVREVTDTENYAYQRYRLQDLQKHTPIMAETQKDDVWAQFKLLLLTLQFEKAIDFIYTGNKLWLEAPIWLFIYLLLRTGHAQVAADYIKENKDIFCFDKKFVAYFQEYMESPQHCVSKETHDEILAEHYRLEYGEGKADPYKSLIYKIIGRCELNKKSTAIIKSQEDYLWLQLMLVREVTDTENYAYQRYRLQDLQKHTPIMAETQKDDVWAQFKLLLLTLQFEKAIDFIYTGNKLWLEATHFATALAYYGLLRVPSASQAKTERNMLIIDQNGLTLFNFPRLIYQYIQIHLSTRPIETLQYFYLLSLYSTKQGYHNDEMITLAKSYLCKVIVKSQNHKEFIDIIYGQREPSILQSQRALLDVNSDQEYAQQILYPVADLLLQSGHCREAIDVCKLSIDYNKLFDILAKELSDVLQQSKLSRLSDTTVSNKDMLQFATQTVQECQQQQHLKALPNADKATSFLLSALFERHN